MNPMASYINENDSKSSDNYTKNKNNKDNNDNKDNKDNKNNIDKDQDTPKSNSLNSILNENFFFFSS